MEVLEPLAPPVSPRVPADPELPPALRARIEREFAQRWREEWGGKFLLHGRPVGAGAIRLDGNDYLSVTGHPDIV